MRIDAATRLAGVIGWPVEHSWSPALHNAAYVAAGVNAVYTAFAVPPDRLGEAIRAVSALSLLGVNITVPHKERVLALCDRVELVAASVGAANTIVRSADGLVAHNTDVAGFQDALDELDPSILGARAGGVGRALGVVLGSGGAARALVLALRERDLEVSVIARNDARARDFIDIGASEILPWSEVAFAQLLPRAALLVDATSAGLLAGAQGAFPRPVPLALLPPTAIVVSLLYRRQPSLLAEARARGLRALDGSGMLVHQAARAFTLMTGRPSPMAAMRAAFDELAVAENSSAP